MCPPVLAVVGLAVQVATTVMANAADRKQMAAIEEQRQRQIEAEQRMASLNKIRAEREAQVEIGRKRALMGALGVEGSEGTTDQILSGVFGAFGADQEFRDEQTVNRMFSIDSTAANRTFDIQNRMFGRTMGLLMPTFRTAGTLYNMNTSSAA